MSRPRWSFAAFARDRAPLAAVALLCIGAAAFVLDMTRATAGTIALVTVLLLVGLAAALLLAYHRDARFWRQLADFSDDPASARFISSLLCEPRALEARLACEALQAQGAAATDEVNAIRDDASAHRRYTELWVHQAKATVAALQLDLAPLHGADADSARVELARIEAQIEQALYCSRAQAVSNDYLIREVKLIDVVNAAVRKQARRMIRAGVAPQVEIDERVSVLTDEKWLVFILGQIMDNSIKYGARRIAFSLEISDANTADGCTWLRVSDDGDGIPAADAPRVFERGFTGEAGRTHHPATGMGLYLVACACRDLGLGIELESEEGAGTAISIGFPQDRRRLELAAAKRAAAGPAGSPAQAEPAPNLTQT